MSAISLQRMLELIGQAIRKLDTSGVPYKSSKPPFREYGPGAGPYSETTLCRAIAAYIAEIADASLSGACTKRFPDLLIPGAWAIELKIARPFGDNGSEAEHWSQNLLHPYPGNTSTISDVMKLMSYPGSEQRAVAVVGYEHSPAKIALDPLIQSFESIARNVLGLPIGPGHYGQVERLIHPVHQVARLWAWEVSAPLVMR